MIKYRILLPEQASDVYSRIEKFLPDNLRNLNVFLQLFLRKDTMFFEVGDYQGVFWFLNIVPGWKADVHIVLWDEKARGLSEDAKRILLEIKHLLRLRRVGAYIPDTPEYMPTLKYVEKIGFRYEGLLKLADKYDDQIVNIHAWAFSEEI